VRERGKEEREREREREREDAGLLIHVVADCDLMWVIIAAQRVRFSLQGGNMTLDRVHAAIQTYMCVYTHIKIYT